MYYKRENGDLVCYRVSSKGALLLGGTYYMPGDRVPFDGFHQTVGLLSAGLVEEHIITRATTPAPRVEGAKPKRRKPTK